MNDCRKEEISTSPPEAGGSLGGTSGKDPVCQCRRQKTQVRSLGWEDPLEVGMATHSSVLAWRIPWTEEPGGLQSQTNWSDQLKVAKSQTNWSNLACTLSGSWWEPGSAWLYSLPFQYKRSLNSNSGKVVLQEMSPPATQFADFPSRVIIPCPNYLPLNYLSVMR